MKRILPFNLVEILLALGVIMIGVVSLIGLFPAASKVTSEANMETYAANAAEEMMAFLTLAVNQKTGTGSTATSGWDTWISNSDTGGLIPAAEPKAMLGSTMDDHRKALEDKNDWDAVTGHPNIFKHKTEKGVFLLVTARGKSAQAAVDLDTDVALIDSRVLITVWKEKMSRAFKAGTVDEDQQYRYGVRLNMKVGWPAERPEAGKFKDNNGDEHDLPLRTIRVSRFDLLKPHH